MPHTQHHEEPIAPANKLAPLIEEYKQLTAWENTIAAASLRIPPLVITGIVAVGVAGKEVNRYYGIGVGFALFMVLVFLGFCDSMVNGIGLHVVEIELRINKYLGGDPLTNLTWHQDYIVHESKVLPGFDIHTVILSVPFTLLLAAGLVQTWFMLANLGWPVANRVMVTGAIASLNAAAGLNMLLAQRRTKRAKSALIMKYSLARAD